MPDYYKILKLSPEASLDDLKHAYRKLAYEYHPDVSKLSNARELFIELSEAYEYLLNKFKLENELKNRRIIEYNETAQSIIDTWMASERERIRKRANNYASMKFRNYKKTKIYKTTEILTGYLNIGTLILGLIVIGGAIIGTWQRVSSGIEQADFSNLAIAVIVSLLGVLMISYSLYKISTRKKFS